MTFAPRMLPGPVVFAALATLVLLAACSKSASPAAPPAAVYGAAPAMSPTPAPTASAASSSEASPSSAPGVVGTGTLDYPDNLQLLLLAYRLVGQTPPLEAWAAQAPTVRTADEFSRAAALKAELERLEAIAASTAETGFLKLKTDCNLSEYDAGRGGYYLPAFEPGVSYSFEAYGEKFALQLGNSADAYLWPLAPDAAREALRKAGMRAVDVDMRIAIGRATRRAGGLLIEGRVLDYRVISRQYGNPAQLGAVVLR